VRLWKLMAAVAAVASLATGGLQAQATAATAVVVPAEHAADGQVTVDPRLQALVKQAYAGVAGSVVCIRTVVTRDLFADFGERSLITGELRNKQWGLMQSMHELRWNSFPAAKSDADLTKAYDAMAAIRKEMFQNGLDTRKKIDEVLTKEQREELGKYQRRGGW